MKQSKLRLITIGPVILFFILLIAFGALLAISAQTSSANLKNAVREVSRPITSASAKLLFNPVYTLNITEANNVISRFVDQEAIVYAAVYDASALKLTEETAGEWIPESNLMQTLSLSSMNANSSQEQEVDQYLLIAQPISVGSEVIGTVVYAFDQSVLRAGLEQAQATLTLAILIALIGASAFVYVFMRNALAPLAHLSEVAQQIGSGELSTTVKVEGYQEVSSLALALDGMRVDLQESYSNLEQRVSDRTRDLEIVAEVGTATSTILNTDKLLQEVVDLTKERFNLYHAHIYLLDEAGKNLELASGAGEAGRQMVAEGHSISLNRERSLVARAARERHGVIVNDVTQAPDFLPNPLLPDTRSELAVPMIAAGNMIGVFDIQSDQVGRFTEADLNIQTTLAAQLAVSIQNVRSFEQAKTQADFESLVNAIGQKIQRAATVEETLQIAVREIGVVMDA
ncbi:MAG: GAF domain-containing protein [Anaerolineales bacterium]|nr:GAF domain-containing protein [Anaerolineales bacterium]MCL4259075.1 GAF domain-containing protein [Anaerolineales bacterium]